MNLEGKFFFMFVFLSFSMLFSQGVPLDSVGPRWVNMYPLEKGNYWVYWDGFTFERELITGDTIWIDGEVYWIKECRQGMRDRWNEFIRIDSTGTLWWFRDKIDDAAFPIMRFNVQVNDSILALNGIDYVIIKYIYLDENNRINIATEYSSDILDSYDVWIEYLGNFSHGGEGRYAMVRELDQRKINGIWFNQNELIYNMGERNGEWGLRDKTYINRKNIQIVLRNGDRQGGKKRKS